MRDTNFESDNHYNKGTSNDVNYLEASERDLFYKLTGVMHFVDKWLEGDELNTDEVSRAIAMREKTLNIVEALQRENNELRKDCMYKVVTLDCNDSDILLMYYDAYKINKSQLKLLVDRIKAIFPNNDVLVIPNNVELCNWDRNSLVNLRREIDNILNSIEV